MISNEKRGSEKVAADPNDAVVANPVVVRESDIPVLKRLASAQLSFASEQMSLKREIERAIVVKDNAFPPNTIRINSVVEILDLERNENAVYTIVLPGSADIHKKKISVLTPMGTALIGLREGDTVHWKMPARMMRFKILKVR